ncbi:hypothetical protein J2Y45_005782 [Dyadobacter sp. BE34]|uniref:DUF5060 domain-containing protein n=1 Tax=Dyadobacter fermentans TaxID=94254 RepID=A0ABU1R7J0_9BACT|nr:MULTISPECIES: DUF5060 domain-containing protein [Dyadobacter]MDR6808570.1 hypothetical protein [Dyadobacter fermentans]MDR7046313.1 hypothetical protein [Dyadobacter sp. BE242]MDR7200626.1 hypothetical protein [Dyadobacter sp. BE34]MDR7218586.1 hypothetical protein [Dyadobacter sp. BE31]MDR7266516.1 hypothetical protein [Dyadobacter sp. BE32]
MKFLYLISVLFVFSLSVFGQDRAAARVERWERFELTLAGPQTGNPFADVNLSAEFSNGTEKIKVDGFYDGNGQYKVRFMPQKVGEWKYRTISSSKSLNGKTGAFSCIEPGKDNHGPVQVADTYHFKYADGTRYYPFGTTLYAWTHQPEGLEEITLKTLANAPFNKVRMCVFPKYYAHVENEPPYYPYVKKAETKDAKGKPKFQWDFSRFEPAFFQHLEKRIDDLKKLGIEADIIVFHPYDKGHWGFDSLGKENDLKYIRYLTARLASFRNVWWSLANEFDYVKTKPRADWDVYTKAVVNADPYGHLCSIHNGSVYYDNWKPEFTHVSIQNGSTVEDFGRATLLRDVFFKPMVYDEVCYEGDLQQRWGHLSGEEMTEAFWQGVIAGTYVTHGETYKNAGDTIFWAKGGRLIGSSPARIGFLRKILEEAPGPLELSDPWKDHHTSRADSSYYLVYLGKNMQPEWEFSLPRKGGPKAGRKFKVEVIDTWHMTIDERPEVFEIAETNDYRIYDKKRTSIRLPATPYLALRIKEYLE